MKHVEWKCQLGYENCDQCNYNTHHELFICAVCGGAESDLPTECPGRVLTAEESDQIMNGDLDFYDSAWHAHPKR